MKEYNTGKYFLNGHGGGEGHSRHRVRAGFTLDQQSPTFSVPRTGRWVSAETTPTKLLILSIYYIYIFEIFKVPKPFHNYHIVLPTYTCGRLHKKTKHRFICITHFT